jgi:hypothetical protein
MLCYRWRGPNDLIIYDVNRSRGVRRVWWSAGARRSPKWAVREDWRASGDGGVVWWCCRATWYAQAGSKARIVCGMVWVVDSAGEKKQSRVEQHPARNNTAVSQLQRGQRRHDWAGLAARQAGYLVHVALGPAGARELEVMLAYLCDRWSKGIGTAIEETTTGSMPSPRARGSGELQTVHIFCLARPGPSLRQRHAPESRNNLRYHIHAKTVVTTRLWREKCYKACQKVYGLFWNTNHDTGPMKARATSAVVLLRRHS